MLSCNKVSKLLSQYYDGQLNADMCKQIAEHLDWCDACQRELEAIRAVSEGLKGLCEIEPSKEFAASLHTRLLQAAREKRESEAAGAALWFYRIPAWLRDWRVYSAAAACLLALFVLGNDISKNNYSDSPPTAPFLDNAQNYKSDPAQASVSEGAGTVQDKSGNGTGNNAPAAQNTDKPPVTGGALPKGNPNSQITPQTQTGAGNGGELPYQEPDAAQSYPTAPSNDTGVANQDEEDGYAAAALPAQEPGTQRSPGAAQKSAAQTAEPIQQPETPALILAEPSGSAADSALAVSPEPAGTGGRTGASLSASTAPVASPAKPSLFFKAADSAVFAAAEALARDYGSVSYRGNVMIVKVANDKFDDFLKALGALKGLSPEQPDATGLPNGSDDDGDGFQYVEISLE